MSVFLKVYEEALNIISVLPICCFTQYTLFLRLAVSGFTDLKRNHCIKFLRGSAPLIEYN